MEADGIVPDVLDKVPSNRITVIYPGDVEVHFGKEITPLQVKDEPKVTWDADPEKYYLFSMVDPDAPSRENPLYGEISHWLIGNIKGSDISTGEVIHAYRGAGPPKGSGLHRYIFIVFEQKEKITFDEPRAPATSRVGRPLFSIRKFAKKYNLGNAWALNYFQAQWDLYVESRWAAEGLNTK